MMHLFKGSKIKAKERLMKCTVGKARSEENTNPYQNLCEELDQVLKKHFVTLGDVKVELSPIGKNQSYITAGVLIKDTQI